MCSLGDDLRITDPQMTGKAFFYYFSPSAAAAASSSPISFHLPAHHYMQRWIDRTTYLCIYLPKQAYPHQRRGGRMARNIVILRK